jgi:mono/diheme cytochrome c family protein
MRATFGSCLVASAVVVAVSLAVPPPAAAGGVDGKQVFLAQKCNLCHEVSSAKIERTSKSEKTKGPDLAGVAKRHDSEWIKKFLAKQIDKDGKKHLKEVKGTPEEIDALVAWLEKQ